MDEHNAEEMDISTLEAKADELIALCDELLRENQTLREERKAWHAERARLNERNGQAHGKLDAMIERLKALDNEP